jgi:hypothetical protein
MKYILSTILTLSIYHLVISSVAAFTLWENLFFSFDGWSVGMRFVYIIGFLLVGVCTPGIIYENKKSKIRN